MRTGQQPRAWVALAILAVLAAVAAVLVVVAQNRTRSVTRPAPTTTRTAPEEELPRIGDQYLLTQSPGGPAVKLQGRPMYNACALLPESQLTATGLKIGIYAQAASDHLSRNSDEHRFAGTVTYASDCGYTIDSPDGAAPPGTIVGHVSVIIEQAPFNDAGPYGQLKRRTEHYQDEGYQPRQTNGVLWYQANTSPSHKDKLNFYLFRPEATDTLFELSVQHDTESYAGKPWQRIAEELVGYLTANIAAGPSGPVRYTYPTPPYDDIQYACDVLTPELFRDYTGELDSGYVEEQYSRGERSFSELGKVLGLRVESICARQTTVAVVEPRGGVELELTLEAYRDQRQAERVLASFCASSDTDRGEIAVEPKIGVATCFVLGEHLVFQAGRYNVWLWERLSDTPPETLIRKMVPIAEKIAAGLR